MPSGQRLRRREQHRGSPHPEPPDQAADDHNHPRFIATVPQGYRFIPRSQIGAGTKGQTQTNARATDPLAVIARRTLVRAGHSKDAFRDVPDGHRTPLERWVRPAAKSLVPDLAPMTERNDDPALRTYAGARMARAGHAQMSPRWRAGASPTLCSFESTERLAYDEIGILKRPETHNMPQRQGSKGSPQWTKRKHLHQTGIGRTRSRPAPTSPSSMWLPADVSGSDGRIQLRPLRRSSRRSDSRRRQGRGQRRKA